MYDGWRVLFKISQAAFICSYLVIFWYYASIHSNGLMINKWVLMRVTFGGYVLSYALGLIYYLVLDKPIRNLDKLVLFPSKISDSFLIKKAQRVQKAGKFKKRQKFQKGTTNNLKTKLTTDQSATSGNQDNPSNSLFGERTPSG